MTGYPGGPFVVSRTECALRVPAGMSSPNAEEGEGADGSALAGAGLLGVLGGAGATGAPGK